MALKNLSKTDVWKKQILGHVVKSTTGCRGVAQQPVENRSVEEGFTYFSSINFLTSLNVPAVIWEK